MNRTNVQIGRVVAGVVHAGGEKERRQQNESENETTHETSRRTGRREKARTHESLVQPWPFGRGQRKKRKTEDGLDQAEFMKSPFDGYGVRFDEKEPMELGQALVQGPGRRRIAGASRGAQIVHRARGDVGGDGNDPVPAREQKIAGRGVVAAQEPKILAVDSFAKRAETFRSGRRLLETDHAGMLRQPSRGLGQKIAGRSSRHVVEDQGDRRGLGDGPEMSVEPFLGRLVVIRRHDEGGVGPEFRRSARPCDAPAGVVRPAPDHQRNPSVKPFSSESDQYFPFPLFERGRFARRSGHDHAVAALGQVTVDQALEGFAVQSSRGRERGDDRHETATKIRRHKIPGRRQPTASHGGARVGRTTVPV
jgi:hypothetical protein